MDNLKQRIEEILDHELAAYPDPSEYEEICLRNTAEILTKFIQENFVPKEKVESPPRITVPFSDIAQYRGGLEG